MIEDILWGLWNGLTAWPLLLLHVFNIWEKYPVYNVLRDGGWYQLGFLLGAGSPCMGMFGRRERASRGVVSRRVARAGRVARAE